MKYRIWRWISVWIIGPIASILVVLYKMPWGKELETKYPNLTNPLNVVLIVSTLFMYFFSILSPFKLYQKLAKRKWDIMKSQCARLNSEYQNKYKFSYNIMLTRKSLFHFLEPFKPTSGRNFKITWKNRMLTVGGEIFKFVWQEGENGVHEGLKISVNQGICGKAYKEGKKMTAQDVLGVLIASDTFDSNFNEDQVRLTNGLIFVACCPLIINEKDHQSESISKVGVLSFESREKDVAELMANPEELNKFYDKIANLANIYANLHV